MVCYATRVTIISARTDNLFGRYHSTVWAGKSEITPKAGLPEQVLRPWNIGKRNIILNGFDGESPTDSLLYKDMTIFYQGKLRVRPLVLFNRFKLMPGELYSQRKQLRTLENMNRLGVFKYTEMHFVLVIQQ